jgi:hypothetical protein
VATEISLPFDLDAATGLEQKVTEDLGSRFFALLARAQYDTGVDSGLLPAAYASGSAGGFRVPAGKALVEGFYYELAPDDAGATKDLPVKTNTASLPVAWRVLLKLDRQANTVRLIARPGAPASPPAPPAPVVTATSREMPVCWGTVAAGAGVVTAIVDERPFLVDPVYVEVADEDGGTTSSVTAWVATLSGASPLRVDFRVPQSGRVRIDYQTYVWCTSGRAWASVQIQTRSGLVVLLPTDARQIGTGGTQPAQFSSWFSYAGLAPNGLYTAVMVHRVENSTSVGTFDNRRLRVSPS